MIHVIASRVHQREYGSHDGTGGLLKDMYRILHIIVLVFVFAGIGINVALPPDVDFCDYHQTVISSGSTALGQASGIPAAALVDRNSGKSGPADNHCRIQLPFANAIPAPGFEIGGVSLPSGHARQGKGLTLNDHPPSPLIGPPRRVS